MLLLTFFVNGQAQSPVKGSVILLKNQNIIPSGFELSPASSDVVDGKFYRIVSFSPGNYPTLGSSNTMFKTIEYLPKDAFILSFNASLIPSEAQLKQIGAVSAIKLEPSMKLSKRLYNNNIPEWAYLNNNKIKIWVQYYRNLDHSNIRLKLQSSGYTILDERQDEHLFSLSVFTEEILEVASLPYAMYVQEMEDPGRPENHEAGTNHRVNYLKSVYPGSPGFDGSGVVVGIGDDGVIGPHVDYKGRLQQPLAGNSTGDHGDHVAGTVFGAGNRDPLAEGMAPGAEVFYRSYPDNLNSVDNDYLQQDVRITTSSYSNGCNAGYTNFTRRMDQDAFDNPELIHVFSAGNDGNSNCGYGAGSSWGNITGGHKIAKNVIAVANLSKLDVLANSSSRGPASDGRIKPDVSGVGTSVYSCTDPNLYTFKSGTSMSCPGVSGTLAVLYEAYRNFNSGSDPDGGLLKAMLMNSCDDLGNPGPDFSFGYGRINARRAFEIIENGQFIDGTLASGETEIIPLSIPPNTHEVRVMLYWSDPPSAPLASRALVNDLDLEVNLNSNTYLPWVLDPSPNPISLNANATRARDSLNNVEQVTILNPSSSDASVTISANSLPGGVQKFHLVYYYEKKGLELTYPVGGETFVPGETETIRWDASDNNGTYILEYSIDGGASWTIINNSIPATSRNFNWDVPVIAIGQAKIRITQGPYQSASKGNFTIAQVPTDLIIASVCPDTVTLGWSPVPDVMGYQVYRLGARYMDSVYFTTSTFAKLPHQIGDTNWYSVSAVTTDGGIGRRAIAIEQFPVVSNCKLNIDLSVLELLSPSPNEFPDCINPSSLGVKLRIKNNGTSPVNGFDVSYRFDNGAVVTNTINSPVPAGSVVDHTFPSSIVNLTNGVSHPIKAWVSLVGDRNILNDTLLAFTSIYTGQIVTLPYTQTFDQFTNCSTSSNCGATSCSLNGGWYNEINNVFDQIDWRTNSGSTPSNNTGPFTDHNTSSSSGKYLYLEASGNCDSNTAHLLSPCIDLSGAQYPILEFWYHMRGSNMGKLHLDLYEGSRWILDIMPVISGNQGNSWQKVSVNLNNYTGKTILLRWRGKTGDDFRSDMSLDNISITENNVKPIPNFTADNVSPCVNSIVNFTNQSLQTPTLYIWEITPSTFTFLNNTSDTSRNISVSFQSSGSYNIKLVAANPFGVDSIIKSNYINVSAGASIPVFQNFQSSGLPPGWGLDNPDQLSEWEPVFTTGNANAFVFDNFNDGIAGEKDGLISQNFNLGTTSPLLIFDVAHAPLASGSNDSLIIEVSNNCGINFIRTSYTKGRSSLQTAAPTNSKFTPASLNEWRSDTLDLSPWTGQDIVIKFVNISDEGNAVYIDNFQIVSPVMPAPSASFMLSDTIVCRSQPITITDLSTGMVSSYNWDFGSSAVPQFANTAGPHIVRFVSAGSQNVSLTVSNSGGFNSYNYNVNVIEGTKSGFVYSVNNAQVNFMDISSNNPDKWFWDFGDGDTSNLQNPVHTYATGGIYTVKLVSSNECDDNEFITSVVVPSGIGLFEDSVIKELSIYPNPFTNSFNLEFNADYNLDMELKLYNITGKIIFKEVLKAKPGPNKHTFSTNGLAKGIYTLKLMSQNNYNVIRLIKQ